jgi:lipid II:glycine glycyltransferase (peptidoglycan interpeptide bridge formation enzyme)
MTWSTFDGTEEEWDSLVRSLGATSPFSVSGWARYKSYGRWTALQAILTDGESTFSAIQVVWFKIFGIVTIAWAPGGPSGTLSFNAKEFLRFVKDTSQSPIAYLRISSHAPADQMVRNSLVSNGWRVPTSFIGARETFVISRTNGKLADPGRLSSNWSRNLQRGLKRNYPCEIWESPDFNELHLLHQQMTEYKKAAGPSKIPTPESLHQMITSMKTELLVVSARDNSGNLIAVRAAFIVGDSAWDAVAASNEVARKSYTSYVCAWKLLEELDDRGINQFDLAGVDFEENTGVFNFKKGLGGERSTYLGEWDVATPRILQLIARIFISRMA